MEIRFKPRPWWLLPCLEYWTTWRWPFQKYISIFYPNSIVYNKDYFCKISRRLPYLTPIDCEDLISHEMIHAQEQWAKWWGPILIPLLYILLPLPYLRFGTFIIEAPAYEKDILTKKYTVDVVADRLSGLTYLWAVPKRFVRWYYNRKLK